VQNGGENVKNGGENKFHHCDRYLEEWTHAEKLAAISRRAKLVRADGLEGRRAKLSELLALYVQSIRCRRC
jgi:hypothetical protein